jgi:hypothetical protein
MVLLDHIAELGQSLCGKFLILTLKIYSFTAIFFACEVLWNLVFSVHKPEDRTHRKHNIS